jgi:hypothetical protein
MATLNIEDIRNSWEVVPIEASDEHPKARFLKLPSGNNTFQ